MAEVVALQQPSVTVPVTGIEDIPVAKTTKMCYYDSMRSTNVEVLKSQVDALRANKSIKVEETTAQNRHARGVLEAVPYFVIPGSVSYAAGKIVTSYVHLDQYGKLDHEAPKIYGVVNRPSAAVVEHAGQRLREAHVLAEDYALEGGIWTPTWRARSEVYVADKVAEPGNAETYVPDRIAHLGALAVEVREYEIFGHMTPQIIGELQRAQDSLEQFRLRAQQG